MKAAPKPESIFLRLLLACIPVIFSFSFCQAQYGGGNAINFVDPTDKILFPKNLLGSSSGISVEFWVKSDMGSAERKGLVYSLEGVYAAYIFTDGGFLPFFDGTSYGDNQFPADLNDGEWHHVAATSDGVTTRAYVDGDLIGARNEIQDVDWLQRLSRNWAIGGHDITTQSPFFGQIDEFRVWTKTLSIQEIRQNLSLILNGDEEDLFLYLTMDRLSGDAVVLDEVNNESGTWESGTRSTIPDRLTNSGAFLGVESISLYTDDFSGEVLELSNNELGGFSIRNIGGDINGVHIIKIPRMPANVNGILPIHIPNSVYYAVWFSGDGPAIYTLQMPYDGFEDALLAEPDVFIYSRETPSGNWGNFGQTIDLVNHIASLNIINHGGDYVLAAPTFNIALPVSLVYFEGEALTNAIELRWGTASESNNSHFELERTLDGENWLSIGTIEGSLNSQEAIEYSFKDPKPFYGLNYYRIKQVDIDGIFTYSQQIAIEYQPVSFQLSVFPNPTTDQLILQLPADVSHPTLRLFHSNGQEVFPPQRLEGQQMQLSLKELPKGVYILLYDDLSIKERVLITKQ